MENTAFSILLVSSVFSNLTPRSVQARLNNVPAAGCWNCTRTCDRSDTCNDKDQCARILEHLKKSIPESKANFSAWLLTMDFLDAKYESLCVIFRECTTGTVAAHNP